MDTQELIYNYKRWTQVTDPGHLKKALGSALKESGYTVLNFVEHAFSPQGYTAIWLLAESHLAVHTFPEHDWAYIELSGCNQAMNIRFLEIIAPWTMAPTLSGAENA